MNPFNVFRKQPPPKREPLIHTRFPEVNSFVYVTIDDIEEFSPIESVGDSSFVIRSPARSREGDTAVFAFFSGTSKFQFEAPCTQLDERRATFVKPLDISLVGTFHERRSAFRIKCALAVQFRVTSAAGGAGEFIDTAIADISIAGASLLLPAEPAADTSVEIRLELKGQGEPFSVLADVLRPGLEQPSGKFLAGLLFRGLGAAEAKAIDSFMVLHQHEIRDRNLALHDH